MIRSCRVFYPAFPDTSDVHTFDSSDDAKVLDPRTAAVLALGEAVLVEIKKVERSNQPMGKLLDKMARVIYDRDRAWRAALAADAEAAR